MNLKYGAIFAALTLAFVACGSDSSSGTDGGDSSGTVLSSAQVPLSSGQVPPSSAAPLSSGQVPPSSAAPLSSGAIVPISSSSSAGLPPVGDLTVDVSTNPMKIVGTVHVEPAFVTFPTISGKVYFNGKEVDELTVSFLNTWGNYTGTGGSAVDVVINSSTGQNSLGAQLNEMDFLCQGRYLAVITMTDGTTTVKDTASYDVGFVGEVCAD